MPDYTLVSATTGRTYQVTTAEKATEQDIDNIISDLDAKYQSQDTGQSRFLSGLSNVGRGALSVIPGAVGGVGYLTEPVIGPGLKEMGEDIESDIESLLPVNPAYEEEFSQKAAGAIGQAGGMLFTGGVAGALGKGAAAARGLGAAEAAAAGTQLAGKTLLGSGFLSGSREGGQAAERYGMEGVSAYTRALLGGAIEGATEKYLFGLGTELAPVKKFLGDTLEKGVGGIAKMGATEAGEEAAAQAGGNIATKFLAPEGVETPGIGSGVGEAAALGGVAGLALGGVTGLLPSGEKAEPATAAESVTVESGEMPLPAVLKTLDEKVTAAVEANADVLPATAAALKDLESGLTDAGEVEGDARQGLPIRRGIATPGQEGVADLGAPEGDVLSLVPKKSPAAPPAEPTDATEGQPPTPRGVGAPPVVTNEPQTPSPAEQPVSAAETPVATEPEAPLQKVQLSEPREELTVVPPSAEIEQPSVIRPVLKRDLIDRKEIARMRDSELAKRLSGLRLFMQGKLESGAPITEAAMENTARLYSEARKRGLMEPEPTIDAYIAEQAKVKKSASPKKETGVTEPEASLPETEKVVAPKAEPEQGAGMPKPLPKRINIAGAEFDVVEANEDGTLKVRNDNGDVFDTSPGEKWTEVVAEPFDSELSAKEVVKMSREDFIKWEIDRAVFRKKLAISKAEEAIRTSWKPKKPLPVGVSKIAAFITKGRYTKEERELLRNYEAAQRMRGAGDVRYIADVKGKVWDALKAKEKSAPEAPAAPAPKAEPEQGAGMTQRDTSKPEQMTPEEYGKKPPVAPAGAIASFKTKKEAVQELSDRIAKLKAAPSSSFKDLVKNYGLALENLYEVVKSKYPSGAFVWVISATHQNQLAAALQRKMAASAEAVDTYGITLPEGYVRQGDLYVFAPEAPPTQTETQPKPEDASKNQVEETGGTPPVESQPPQTRPEGEAQEGASQRGREGEEVRSEKAAPGVEPGAAAEAPLPQTQQTPVARPSGEPFAAPTAESRAAAPGQLATARSVIDEERKRLGRPPVEGPIMEAISDEAIYAQAKAEYDKDPEVGNRLVDSLNARPRAVDSLQQAILGQELVRRRNALDIASDAYIADPKNTQLEDEFNKASARYEEAKFAAQYGISDVGRTLRLARVLLNLDFSKAGLITRFRQASGGVDPNAEQLKKIDELSNTILESEKKVEELRATKEENARLQELLDNMVQDMKDQAIREFNSVEKARKEAKAAFKAAPNKVSALDTLEEKIRARRAERKKKVMADPFLLNALADAIDDVMLGAIKIAKGVRNVAKWMSEMKAENPDYTDEQLQEIRKASENFYENEIKPELGAEAPAAEVVEEETLEDEEGEEGKVFVTFDDVTGRDIYRMVKDRVQKGMTEIGEVMKSVTEEIQQQLPDVTERQVRDRFSGYGRPLFPSQEASAKKVRELRTLAQYASKIEDAQKKIAPLRSGRQRDDATEAIRQAQKELYRLMKENGLEMPPGPRSLKAPLDVIKRRLKNRRDDLQRQMTAGKRDVVSTKKIERDAEAKALEEEIRALDEALDALDPPLPPSYQDKVKDRMRAVDKEIVELRRKIKERDVSKQKPEPIITEQLQVKLNERDALKQALDDLRIEIEGEPQLTQEEINERAERVLDRNIDALEAEIERLKDPNYFPQEAQKAEATPTIIRLRKQQEILREERKKLSEARFGKKVKSESERVDIAIAALEKSIDNINQKILTGDLSPTARKGTPLENAKIKNLRAERNSLRSVMNLMRKAKADAAKDPVAEQIRRDRKYLQSRIEYYENIQKKMADGTYKPKVKEQRKYDESLGKELQKLEDAKMAVADMLLQERLKNRSTLRKAFDFIGDLFGIQRVLTATADISAIGNQGNFILFSNPKIAFKAIPDMLRAMKTPEGEKAVQERIRNMPEYKDGELNRVGLYLSMDAGPNSPLSKMEEQYATRLVNKWPKAFGGGIVRGSERAYKTFLDVIRVAAYKSMKETLVKGGWFTPPQEATQERLEALSNLVNNATGRGSFKMKKADQLLSQAAPFLNTFIFAPRFGLSRFAMALGLPLWRASPGTRALIAQEYAKYAIGVTVATLLLSLAQDDEDEPIVPDPRATDFLKTRFGDYRVDLLGGFQQPFVFLTRLLTGETVTSKGKVRALREGDRPLDLFRERPLKLKPNYGSPDASSVVGDFLRFKLAPTSASILNALSGKDPVGNRTDVKSEILKAPVPLVVGQLVDSLSAEDPADAALLSTLGLTGIRTSYQGKDADKNKTEWEKMVKKVEELTGIK